MNHIIQVSGDSRRVVHYNPDKQTLDLMKLSTKITNAVHPSETITLRLTTPIAALSIHPKFPEVIAIPSKSQQSISVPKGPGEKSGVSVMATKQATKATISLNHYRTYNKELVFNPLILEYKASMDNKINVSPLPWLLKYSPCGKYLAIHTRIVSPIHPSFNEILIFDAANEFTYITSANFNFSVEDLEWVCDEDSIKLIAACIDGQLRIFSYLPDEEILKCEHEYNISSSPLSSISYRDSFNVPGLLIGTRDGNTYIMDPNTMICSYSNLVNNDLPVLCVSKGNKDIDIITFVNENAHLVRIEDGIPKEVKQIVDLNPRWRGVYCTNNGTVIMLNKEGDLKLLSMHQTLKTASLEEKPKENKESLELFKVPDKEMKVDGDSQLGKKRKRDYGIRQDREGDRNRERDRDRDRDNRNGRDKRDNRDRDYDRDRDYWVKRRR